MNYYTMFLDDKVLITILKVIKLNRDLQEVILDIIMADIIQTREEEHYNFQEVIDILQLIENVCPFGQDDINTRIMLSFLINNDLQSLFN